MSENKELLNSVITDQEEESFQQEEEDYQKKSCKERYFGPMLEGSLRGAILTLLAGAMGTGMFNLPLRASEIGVIPFTVFVFLCCLFSLIGMTFITRLIIAKKYESFSDMSQAAFGTPFMRLAQFCVIIYPWGNTICYQVILAKFVCQILQDEFHIKLYENREEEIYTKGGNLCRIFVNLGCMLLCLIFALKKKINLLQKLALVGVISVVFNFTVIVIISMTGFTRPDDHLHYRGVFHVDGSKISWAISSSWRSMSILAQGLASIVFCYVNHQLLFPLSNSLKRPSLLRFKKIILRLHAVELIIYSILGIMAYLLLLEHIKVHEIGALVITSIPIIPVKIGKFLMVLALFFAIPINAFPARQSILEACKLENSNKNHVIVTLSLLMSSCAIAIAFQKVNSYFGLLGGTAGVLMSAGIPSICYYRLADKISKLDVLFLIIVAFTSVVAGVGAFLSVFNPV